ncbi:MAG: hydroxymethylbilane synthase, partial [Hyphomonadaceae bacterium]|nr:hydroxymethylbilane synthase [Hyphomonadaceae bacterium]
LHHMADLTARPLRIGARGSPLSLAQTGQWRDALAAAWRRAPDTIEIVPIVTSGDRIQDRRLIDAGGKGLFTKELDEALLDGRVDITVHSMKDLPTALPDGIVLSCAPLREDPRDAVISAAGRALRDLPQGARIGTASLRRQAQVLMLRPDFEIVMLRGNVETRLRRVQDGDVDATFLAIAGLKRLGYAQHAGELLDAQAMPPAACQGALAVTTRDGDAECGAIVEVLEDAATRLEISAERRFLAALDGSCRTPIAALGRWRAGTLAFVGEALTPDGRRRWRREGAYPCATVIDAEAIGARLGAEIRAEAGTALMFDH